MNEPFDPYYRWLGIPPEEQPPDHYRLLGLRRFEDQPDVIVAAADRQMGHLRTFQSGKHGNLSQRLLNQVAAAKVCLLNPARKERYDEHLQSCIPEAVVVDAGADGESAGVDPTGFGEYELLEPVGSGRTGQVYKARHRTMGRVVAVKLLSPEARRSPGRMERFRRKARILARLEHPNLPAVYDAGVRDSVHFLIMEYVDGWDLAQVIAEHGPLAVDVAVDYTVQAAAGLGCAHAHGIVHRNVKPSNLLVDDQGVVKVIGFGIARITDPAAPPESPELEHDLTLPGKHLGTPNYMAPEQAVDAHNVGQRADVYSLGCTLHSFLTGRPPFTGKKAAEKLQAHRQAPVPSLRSRRPDVSPELDAIFTRMLAKLPIDRQQSMEELIAELRALK